jgi:hypothetical protein
MIDWSVVHPKTDSKKRTFLTGAIGSSSVQITSAKNFLPGVLNKYHLIATVKNEQFGG